MKTEISNMDIFKFIASNWDSLLVVIMAAAVLIWLYFRGHKKWVYTILYSLVTEAEKQFGGGTGELKQAYVIKQVYNALPALLKTFISAERIGKWVDDALLRAKKKWAENGNIADYIGGAK